MSLPSRLVLLGHPVAQSLSPRFQNAALRAAGLPVRYEALDVRPSDLDATLLALVDEGAAGNVTIPHKEAVAKRCDVLTPLALETGAVNTWWSQDGRLHGDNTDVGGFDDAALSLLGQIPVGASVAVIGAGGSARAVLAAVRRWPGARATVWSRRHEQAAAICPLGPLGATVVARTVDDAVGGATLVVNCTPVGMRDEQMPIDGAALSATSQVIDLVYRRGRETALVAAVLRAGGQACSGLPMLIGQGARAFERWTGIAPDRDVMWAAAAHPDDDGAA